MSETFVVRTKVRNVKIAFTLPDNYPHDCEITVTIYRDPAKAQELTEQHGWKIFQTIDDQLVEISSPKE